MSLRVIDAICVTSDFMGRSQVEFDESSGLITRFGDLKLAADETYPDTCLLFAGMGDIHIHAREDVSGKNNYKEDFISAKEAMDHGGVTHAGDMPNNPVPPVDAESYEAKVRLGEKVQGAIWFYAGIGPETRPLPYKIPYKVYMGPSIGELFFKDLESLDQALKHYEGQWVSFHCEDPEILEDHKTQAHHHEKRPVIAESVATRDAVALITKYKLSGKLCHYSSEEGLNLVREARRSGSKILLEVTPQHLYFNIEELQEQDYKRFQMNPPIRFQKDRVAMMEALKNGEIDFLATDHAPHTKEEKEKGISGLTGLDTFAGFVSWLISQGMDPKLIAKVAAENPGSFFNEFLPSWKKITRSYESFGSGLGFLKPGYRANFTVINTQKPLSVSSQILKTKVAHSPFEGHTFPGQLEALYHGGKRS